MKEEVKKWWKIAKRDLDTSKYNLKGNILAAAAFYAQQAVEKGLKAVLIQKNKPFEKTHDVVKLSILVESPDRIRILCAKIQPVYIESRYPDAEEQDAFTKKDYIKELVNNADEIIKWIGKKLEKK